MCDFVSTGAGCGVAAAFKAPLAGILFVVEEASSYFSLPHLHKTFAATVAAYFTAKWLATTTSAERYEFEVAATSDCGYKALEFLTFTLVGLAGGILGSLFNQLVIIINNFRAKFVNGNRSYRVLDALCVILLTTTIIVLSPTISECKESRVEDFMVFSSSGAIENHCIMPEIEYQFIQATVYVKNEENEFQRVFLYRTNSSDITYHIEENEAETSGEGHGRRHGMSTRRKDAAFADGSEFVNGTCDRCTCGEYCHKIEIEVEGLKPFDCGAGHYNEMASLFHNYGATAVKLLLKRGVPKMFEAWTLVAAFFFYMLLACITCGMTMPTGLVIPMLFMGCSMGRLIGLFFFTIDNTYDPGLYALVGAAAFMGGSGKILMFLAIVLLEITNDMNMLPPICWSLMVALYVGKLFNHGLYHELIHIQGLPYLDASFDLSLSNQTVGDVMLTDLIKFNENQTAQQAWDHLREKYDNDDDGKLTADEMARSGAGRNFTIVDDLGYFRGIVTIHRLRKEVKAARGETLSQPLSSIMRSTQIIARPHWTLHYGYCVFQKLGLRNMPVVDEHNKPLGMITKLTLMPWWQQVRHSLDRDQGGLDFTPRSKKNNVVIVKTEALDEPSANATRGVATI